MTAAALLMIGVCMVNVLPPQQGSIAEERAVAQPASWPVSQPSRLTCAHDAFDDLSDLRVAQPRLGLPLELGVGHLQPNRQTERHQRMKHINKQTKQAEPSQLVARGGGACTRYLTKVTADGH